MKITFLRNTGKHRTMRTIEMDKGVDLMRKEIKSCPITKLRECLQYAAADAMLDEAEKVPVTVFGCEIKKNANDENLLVYNGLITLEVNGLVDVKEAEDIRMKAQLLPQTMVAYIGSSNRSVKIVVPFCRPDGSLPQQREQMKIFHAHAYQQAVKWYQPQLSQKIELKQVIPEQACRMTYDPNLYYNAEAQPIRMEQPLKMPATPTYEEKLRIETDSRLQLIPGYEKHDVVQTLFNSSLHDALNSLDEYTDGDDQLSFLARLSENCFNSGIPEEDAVRWTLNYHDLKKWETKIRLAFRDTYLIKRRFGAKPCLPRNTTLAARLDEFMQRRYQLRRNVMKGIVEYRDQRSLYYDFHPLTKQTMNTIGINAQYEGLEAWDVDIRRYVESDLIPPHNPIETYLSGLDKWDGIDRIGQLADRITCDGQDVWHARFHIWFLSMVAHWLGMEKKHANSVVPLLIGKQGCGKSTFCANLLPGKLQEYYTDSIDLSKRRETELALNRFLLINMDEFDSISASYQGFLKHILQKAVIQTRKPYGTATEQLRRYATFMATSNNFDLLTDPTGSRRFICVDIKGMIDYSSPVNHQQLYAQAIAELKNNGRYWFTHDEEIEITRDNLKYKKVSMVEDFFRIQFRQPEKDEKAEELNCSEILERIKKQHKGFNYTKATTIKLGQLLNSEFESRRIHRGNVYKLVEVSRIAQD